MIQPKISPENVEASASVHDAIFALPESISEPLLSVVGVLLTEVNREFSMTMALRRLALAATNIRHHLGQERPSMKPPYNSQNDDQPTYLSPSHYLDGILEDLDSPWAKDIASLGAVIVSHPSRHAREHGLNRLASLTQDLLEREANESDVSCGICDADGEASD